MQLRHDVAVVFIALFMSPVAAAADKSSLELVQTVALKGRAGGLDHLALDAKTERLFLANKANNTLDVIDLKAGKLLRQITAQQGVQGVIYVTELDKVFATLGSGGFLNVFNGSDLKLVKTVKFMDDADNLRFNPKTGLVYVAHADKALGVVDAKTYELKADIKLTGAAEGFQLETGRPRLYLNTPSPSQVVVIDTDKNEVINKYPLKLAGGNVPLALDEANHRIFVGCRKAPLMVVIDSETGKELTSVAIGTDVDDLFFDAKRKRLYAACSDGFLYVLRQLDKDRYEELEKVSVPKGAHTCLFDADSSRLFLAVPRQGDKEPEVRVYKVLP
jgi:hypothetical protein